MIYLVLLVIIVSTVTYFRILAQIEIGPISDSFDFLSNALVYAGQGMGYADLLRPPFFGFLISLVFRMGYISTNAVFYMDGLLFILGVIGLYFLLKLRFNDLESFLGALLYATFPIVITILGVGFSDLASVSITIWAIYFTVLAVKKDSKYFYLSFPLLMMAFLTRYNNALLIFPVFLYLLMNKDKINIKQVIMGMGLSILIIAPVLIFFYQEYGSIIYPFINFGASSAAVTGSTETFAYNPDVFFFVENFPSLVGLQGIFVILMIIFGGLALSLYKFIKKDLKWSETAKLALDNRLTHIKLVILLGLIIIFVGTFGKLFYMVNEVLFFIIAYLTFDITRNLNTKHLNLNWMFFAWFMTFFIFNSIFVMKDLRYFVMMAPPVAYFMILGLSEISQRIPLKFKNRNIIFPTVAILITIIMLFSTASQIPEIVSSNQDKKVIDYELKESSQWFINYDPNYKNQNIYSDLGPNYSWYLKTDVKTVPIFKDNQTFANGVKNETFNQADSDQYNNFLITNKADYYLSLREGLNLTSYTAVKQIGDVTIYKRNN
ncbi:MAG: glycosyltransferase family 39 protein [Methanobacterium sp.]|nr:glycosyltransferase family 39 protein [Methanobacterium sp.]